MSGNVFSRVEFRLVVGLFIAAAGVVLTLLSFSLRGAWSVQRFWPLLVIAFGLSRVIERPSRLRGLVLLIVGVVVQLSNLGLFALPSRELVRYWPLLVVAVGVWEVARFRRLRELIEGLAVLLLGLWLQLSYFGLAPISSYRAWPLLLAAIGGASAQSFSASSPRSPLRRLGLGGPAD